MIDENIVIRADKLYKTYKLGKVKVPALKNISLEIRRGEMICINGRSGSGKSTLLRQLSLIDRPNRGAVFINAVPTSHLSDKACARLRLAQLGYVFQEYALLPELTAQENVMLPALMLDGAKSNTSIARRAYEVLKTVGLAECVNHRPNELSGGQQQRVAIARALINTPSIIFADEPTANLDSLSARTVMDTLRLLNKEHDVTVVFVSHDPDDVIYANRIITLDDGKITKEKK